MAYESYIAGHRRHREELRRQQEEERESVLKTIRELRGFFDELPELKRVYVFGSAATQGGFTDRSDVDLAFEGLSVDRFCGVLSELVERLGRSVDAVRLEDVSAALRQRVLQGNIVYERRASKDR